MFATQGEASQPEKLAGTGGVSPVKTGYRVARFLFPARKTAVGAKELYSKGKMMLCSGIKGPI